VVDVTNYVMLELGQPMHAFDLARLSDGIEVRPAAKGERLRLLDGREIELSHHTLVIADGSGAVALAGIMGGDSTAVGENTRDIFLESAFFSPRWIAGRPRRYALSTDSAHRFERGVDPALQTRAMERATRLLLDIVGGKPGPVSLIVDDRGVEAAPTIALRQSRIRRVLGTALSPHEVSEILTRLGMELMPRDEAWQVTPPSYRFDIRIESDLIEELARIHGYNRLPRTHPDFQPRIHRTPETALNLNRLRDVLVERGYEEAITYSFVDAELQRMLDPKQEALALENPISADMSVMRTSLWPGLVRTLQQNLNRQQTRVRLFETGLRFLPHNGHLEQNNMLAGLVSGAQFPEQWDVRTRPVDFFDAKGDLEALLICAAGPFSFEKANHPGLHPGQTARVLGPAGAVGWLGVLHPTLESAWGLSQSTVLFELELDVLEASPLQRFKALSRFPSIRRDIAILVDSEVSVQRVLESLYEAAPPYLTNVTLFDVYTGEGVVSGRKSLALGLILQELSRTLTEGDIEDSVAGILRHLEQSLGATLRE
jgi:phenylalanyl-tRNA synthetase beta chain